MARELAFKLVLFGDGGVGKTTLTHRFLTRVFDEDLKMTIGADFSVKELEINGKTVVLRIWDFAGERKFRVLLPSFSKGADGGIFMYDITRYSSIKNVNEWLSFFKKKSSKIPFIMVGGKLDLQDKRSVSTEEAIEISKEHDFKGYIECSSKTGDNVDEVFEFITQKMMESKDNI
jgi:small GTP-binding protein